jgi:hypothetical protein
MILTIAAIIAVLWLLGLIGHIGGAFINILIVVAIIMVLAHLFGGRRGTTV